MSLDSDTDRISSLPKNAIEAILTCLPIRDAVRTSMLSRGWRYAWSSLPLVLNDQSFTFLEGLAQAEKDREIVKIIDHILLLHCGPINKFKFSVALESCISIDRWILFLSRNGIKEFILDITHKGQNYNLPSCLFSCSDLTYLDLYRCSFMPPTSFQGFKRLTTLVLWSVMVAGNGLEILLSRCPLLKNLKLICITGCSRLEISAQKLVDLTIQGAFVDLHFRSTPLLATASINFTSSGNLFGSNRIHCRIVDVFGQIPSIHRFDLLNRTLQYWSVGDVPARLPATCPVKYLLIHINFEDLQEMLAAFCIFRSSPAVKKLVILAISNKDIARTSVEDFWEGEAGFDCTFSHLQAVEITAFTGVTFELKFVELVLAKAPVLERLHIQFRKDVECVSEILRKLVRFPRSSPKAEVIVPA